MSYNRLNDWKMMMCDKINPQPGKTNCNKCIQLNKGQFIKPFSACPGRYAID